MQRILSNFKTILLNQKILRTLFNMIVLKIDLKSSSQLGLSIYKQCVRFIIVSYTPLSIESYVEGTYDLDNMYIMAGNCIDGII